MTRNFKHENLSLFQMELTNLLGVELVKARLFAKGDINFSPNWKDAAVQALIGSGVIISVGVISILVAAGVIVLLPGITIPISLTGLALGIGYTYYRTAKKQKEYGRINVLFHQRNPEEDLAILIKNIITMYQLTIKGLATKDVLSLAKQFSKIIIRLMKKDKIHDIEALLEPCSLYQLIVSQKKHIPKDKIATQEPDNAKKNIRSAIVKTGLYSENNPHHVYIHPKSRPNKYGLLFFKRSADFEQTVNPNTNYRVLEEDQSELLILNSGVEQDIEDSEQSASYSC